MTRSEYEAEVKYWLCKSIFTTLVTQEVITQENARNLLRAAVEKYHTPIGGLEVNSIAGEKNYTG